MPTDEQKKLIFLGLGLLGIGLLLFVILFPISLAGVEYYQFAFRRSKTSGRVDTSQVYEVGRYHVGVLGEFKTFPADSHFVYLNDLGVFTSDRLEVDLDCTFQYFLRLEDLQKLHDKYDIAYEDIIRSNAIDAIKSATIVYSTRDFGTKRAEIEDTLFQAVRERLGGICCPIWCDLPEAPSRDFMSTLDCNYTISGEPCVPRENCTDEDLGNFATVRYFQLGFVDIPDGVISRNLLTLTQLEDGEKEQFVQDADVVKIETQKAVKAIENEAEEISQNATAQANLIRSRAAADARATVEDSYVKGLANMYEQLNVTTQEQKASLNYLRQLRFHQNLYMSVNFNSLISARGFN